LEGISQHPGLRKDLVGVERQDITKEGDGEAGFLPRLVSFGLIRRKASAP
jgi:hypothetical protein